MQFTWDPKKAASNLKKHKVSFEEAQTVFSDPFAAHKDDDSAGETRVLTTGKSAAGRTLFVVAVEIETSDLIRIISARRATPAEIRAYEKH